MSILENVCKKTKLKRLIHEILKSEKEVTIKDDIRTVKYAIDPDRFTNLSGLGQKEKVISLAKEIAKDLICLEEREVGKEDYEEIRVGLSIGTIWTVWMSNRD